MPESYVLMALSQPRGEGPSADWPRDDWDVIPHDADGGAIVFPNRAAAEEAVAEIRADTPDWYSELVVVPVADLVAQFAAGPTAAPLIASAV